MHVTTASKGPLEKKKLWSYGTAGWGGCEICTGDTNRGLCGLSAELRRIRLCHEVRNYRVKMPEGADMQSAQERAAFSSDGNILLILKPLKISCVWTFLPRLPLMAVLYELFQALNATTLPSGSQRFDAWLLCNLRRPLYWKYSSAGHMSVKSPQLSTHWPAVSSMIYSNVTPCYRDRSSSHGIH